MFIEKGHHLNDRINSVVIPCGKLRQDLEDETPHLSLDFDRKDQGKKSNFALSSFLYWTIEGVQFAEKRKPSN